MQWEAKFLGSSLFYVRKTVLLSGEDTAEKYTSVLLLKPLLVARVDLIQELGQFVDAESEKRIRFQMHFHSSIFERHPDSAIKSSIFCHQNVINVLKIYR